MTIIIYLGFALWFYAGYKYGRTEERIKQLKNKT